ncbi:MAG TPA: DUF4040 domain-containing protein, partial [Ottowia sp.]|nr:DUF4040 domain-containing protein [Ottowia sp.]
MHRAILSAHTRHARVAFAIARRAPRTLGTLLLAWLAGVALQLQQPELSGFGLYAVLLLGAVGLIVSWLFVALSAPDLALTQL